ncbi:MAG: YHS domain-containing (seleno)protein [Planctomycetota bacterium]
MKKRFTAVVLGAAVFATYFANAAHAADESMMKAKPESRAYLHGYNVPSSGIALEGYCPVAYFAVNKAIRGKQEFAVTHNDVTYYFVNADAMKLFQADPVKYLPAYGGWCATGMAMQHTVPVDPTNFKIVNGRLLLFLANKNIDTKQIWNQRDEKGQLAKADAHWQTINK